ncbi:hypothetical protein A9Q77_07400 [Marinomonas sp. 42_23_T18]|nr:hypothetical protein A9Q77_07400 [Marinomonas sp. 42_23_T18]
MNKFKIAGLAMALGLATNLYASDFSYNYIDIAVGKSDSSDISSASGDYSSISGSFVFQDAIFFSLESTTYEFGSTDADTLQFGVGAFTATGSTTDLYGAVRIANSEIGTVDESGFQIDVGLRSQLTSHVGVDGRVKYNDVFDDAGMGYMLAARYYPAPQLSFGVGYEYYDFNGNDINTVLANFRYNF